MCSLSPHIRSFFVHIIQIVCGKPLFRPKHVCFNDFLLVPSLAPLGHISLFDLLQENLVQSIVHSGLRSWDWDPSGAWLVSQLVGIITDMLMLINWFNLELPACWTYDIRRLYISSPQTKAGYGNDLPVDTIQALSNRRQAPSEWRRVATRKRTHNYNNWPFLMP